MPISPWIVSKFGGTSVNSAVSWQTIAQIIQDRERESFKQLIVCSAIRGVSDTLAQLIIDARNGDFAESYRIIVNLHTQLALELGFSHDNKIIEKELQTLQRLATGISLLRFSSPALVAEIMGLGELMSTRLGAAWLNSNEIKAQWIDARDHLICEGSHENAYCKPNYDENLSAELLNMESDIFITQGFIARNNKAECVILGRGGSDTSAAYFGVMLAAQTVEIWTDVPGMFTANPHEIPSALLLPELDYEEAQELASAGANILHPRCIEPLKCQQIPLEIKWMERPSNKGTAIKKSSFDQNQQLKAVICKKSVYLVSIDTTRMWQKVGFLAEIFNCFKEQGLSIDLVTTSQNNVTITLDNQLNPLNINNLDELLTKLSFFCEASYKGPCASISLIGKGARPIIHELNPLKQYLQEKRVYMISQSASDINYSFVVDEDDAVRVSRILHAEFFSNVNPKRNLGPSWNALLSNKAREVNSTIPWWQNSADILIAKAKSQSPVYAYNKATVVNNLTELKKITAINKIFYAIKANSHQQILTTVANHDFGFECVSIEEILWVKKLFPDIKTNKILFTPSFANIEEYRKAFNLKCFITVDNLWLLQKYPEVFAEQKFLIRIDPQTPQGHHKHVKTAGTESKFGISTDDLTELFIQAKKINASIVGFHAHVGSGVLVAETWRNTALLLAQLAEQYPSVSILNLGGGLGIVEKPEQHNLDLEALNQGLEEIKIAYPQYDFWLEPGRYVVASAGVLLAQVTQIKNKKYKHFIGINAGMNSFLRPALYGSFHPIVNLTKLQHKHSFTADIVGPICESGDVMGYNRSFPETDPGDVVLIANTGAYGHVMSSHYNLKMPAEEIWLT